MRDRRQERRQQTIDDVVESALGVMVETGAAGLSLGEVAKRMGMRTPSLYGYFPSKAALCDEIFARGWREVGAAMSAAHEELQLHDGLGRGGEPAELILRHLTTFITWALDHRPQAELMFWRPVPGWEPSAEAYARAVDVVDGLHRVLATMQRGGLLLADAPVEQMARVVTVLCAGVISQQLSNQPGTPLAEGVFAGDLPRLVAMFLQEFGAERPVSAQSRSTRKKASR